jgi:glucose/arabinose dehydrogenase
MSKFSAAAALALIGVLSAATPALSQTISLQAVRTGLANPIGITHAGDGSGRLFVNLQRGRIVILKGTQLVATPFLDISSKVSCCDERGLLGVAFHPQYKTNGWFFVSYTDTGGDTKIERYSVSAGNPDVADANSGVMILSEQQPFANHNGGQIHFGKDGFLYIGLGDGGDGGDPGNRAQSLSTRLGKMLRINVNGTLPYTIPSNNPFRGGPRPEIWAYGLRNPWSFSFDRQTGDLYIGDVGQSAREEIDFQPAASAGGQNYGWRRMEGKSCFNPASNCNDGTLTLPILDYPHGTGDCSVTGGRVYRGARAASLVGTYFYGDLCSGKIWGAKRSGSTWTTKVLQDTPYVISAFGEDESGEVYVAHIGGGTDGAIYRIASTTAVAGEIVVDNLPAGAQDATRKFTGKWCRSTGANPWGADSLYSCGAAADTYRWVPQIPTARAYDVYVRWTTHRNRAASVPLKVIHAGGTATKSFNQKTGGAQWTLVGRFSFNTGSAGYVEVSDAGGQACADAVRLVPAP